MTDDQKEQAMSAHERDVAENNRTLWIIYGVIGIISLLLVGGIIFIARKPVATNIAQSKLEGALRSGSPDFEKYKALITVDTPEADESARAIGDIAMTLRTTVRNFTGRTINGLEVRGVVVDLANNPVKERSLVVIPSGATGVSELDPNKTLAVTIYLEGISKEADRANIKMEITAVRFK
jgi:hypothetical protein